MLASDLEASTMKGRVGMYLRVSTDGQTTENQWRELEAVAARSGWEVVDFYEDAGSHCSVPAGPLVVPDWHEHLHRLLHLYDGWHFPMVFRCGVFGAAPCTRWRLQPAQ